MEIRELDSGDALEGQRWYAAMHAGAAAGRVAPMVVPETAVLTSLRTNATNRHNDRRGYGAWDGETCLGTLLVAMPRIDNTHSAELDVNVPPAHRGRGVGAALFDYGYAVARDAGRTTFHGEVNIAPDESLADRAGGRFALARGFASQHVEHRLMLDVPVPEAYLAELDAYAHRAAAGYRALSWLGMPPEEWIDRFADMHTLMDRDVPIGELDFEPVVYDAERVRSSQSRLIEQGYGIVTTMILDAGGAPAAYTMMFAVGAHVMQNDTFVLRARRGHRLGTVAKVANLRQLAEHYPAARHVHTWTAQVNDAMRSINERFGFRDVETLHELELTAS